MRGTQTKIIATIGPSSQSVRTLTAMIRAGVTVARLNFSHGTHASHRKLARHVRQASRLAKRNVALLADLQGPKIRLGDLNEEQRVQKGDVVTLPLSTSGLSRFLK